MNENDLQRSLKIRELARRNSLIFLAGAAIGAVIAAGVVLLYTQHFGRSLSNDPNHWADFGGYLGGVLGPFFAFTAFLVLLKTLQDQQVRNAEDRERQFRQDFETTFFTLLRIFSEVVADITFAKLELIANSAGMGGKSAAEVTRKGREAMRSLWEKFKETYGNIHPEGPPADLYEMKYGEFYRHKDHQAQLGIYFRTLYRIFDFVNRSGLSSEERARYANVVRAQLSAYELGLTFYNCLWDEGKDGFKPLVERYGVLKHLKEETVLRKSDLTDDTLYSRTAFVGYKDRMRIWNNREPKIVDDD
jgi:hypothetical protein